MASNMPWCWTVHTTVSHAHPGLSEPHHVRAGHSYYLCKPQLEHPRWRQAAPVAAQNAAPPGSCIDPPVTCCPQSPQHCPPQSSSLPFDQQQQQHPACSACLKSTPPPTQHSRQWQLTCSQRCSSGQWEWHHGSTAQPQQQPHVQLHLSSCPSIHAPACKWAPQREPAPAAPPHSVPVSRRAFTRRPAASAEWTQHAQRRPLGRALCPRHQHSIRPCQRLR